MWLDGKWEMNFSGPKAKSREALKTQQLCERGVKFHHAGALLVFPDQSVLLDFMLLLLNAHFHHITLALSSILKGLA